MMEAESQAVLNTLKQHNFQDAFKNHRSAGNGAYTGKRNTSRKMVAIRPKVSFSPDGSTVLEIMDIALYVLDTSVYRNCNGSTTSSNNRNNANDVMILIKFLPHEYALGDKQVLILLSESHVHVCTLEKMTPRRYVH
jgi:hypothetical protein